MASQHSQRLSFGDMRASCRVCMSEQGVVNIFQARSVLQMLQVCSPVQFTKEEGLPDSLCNVCLKNLQSAYKFWMQCKESHTALCDILKLSSCDKSMLSLKIKNEIDDNNIKIEDSGVDIKLEAKDECVNSNQKFTENVDGSMKIIEFCDASAPVKTIPLVADILDKLNSLKRIKMKSINERSVKNKRRHKIVMKEHMDIASKKGNKNNRIFNREKKFKKNKKNINEKDKPNAEDGKVKNSQEISAETQDASFVINDDSDNSLSSIMEKRTEDSAIMTCCFCELKFPESKDYTDHMDGHKKEEEACTVCQKKIVGRYNILRHQGVHELHPCEQCGKILSKYYLKKHVRNIHGGFKKACPICQSVLTSYDYYRQHVKRHTKKPEFLCDFCQKKCTSKAGLANHINTHTNNRPYKCSFCDMGFTMLKTKQDHECLHTGARPYACPLCDKCFIQRCNWKSHFVHNHKEYNYKEFCKKVVRAKM